MVNVDFKTPVLVRKKEWSQYHLRPLFLSDESSMAKRYEKAIFKLQVSLRKAFHLRSFSKSNMQDCLWYLFDPEVALRQIYLDFKSGSHSIYQKFTCSLFSVNGHLIAHFPDFDNYMSVLQSEDESDPGFLEEIAFLVKTLVREERKRKGDDFDPADYRSVKGEFVTRVPFAGTLMNEIPRELKLADLFAALSADFNFIGLWELKKVAKNLNQYYPDDLLPAVYVDKEINRVRHILFQPNHVAVAVIGEIGTGKSTLIHGALRKYLDGLKKPYKRNVRELYNLDPNRIISGMSVVGMWQKRVESILDALIDLSKTNNKSFCDLIYIDNPVALFRVGKSSQNNMTISQVIKPYIEKRIVPFVLEATPDEWKVIQETDRRFADLFQVIKVDEPPYETAVDITLKHRLLLERDTPTRFSNEALVRLLNYQRQYVKNEALPGSVLKKFKQVSVKFPGSVDAELIDNEFRDLTRYQNELLNQGRLREKQVLENLERSLIGQKKALNAIANVIHIIHAKLNDPSKPMASLLFIGPTGVGKTEAVKVLTRFLFGAADKMVRFDMNEYIDSGAVTRLIGDFYNPEGQLTGSVRHNPFCVLLLDEIEKAHPDVHDLLLQVLGEGRLTDSIGRTVDFTNTIIIMTSNLGAEQAGRQLGFQKTDSAESLIYKKAVEDFFRPEFINRIEEIIGFHKLAVEDVIQIANLMIKNLLKREGFVRRTTILKVQQDALETIARSGYESELGARSLKRSLEKEITELAANHLINVSFDTPVLLELLLCKDRLVPRITALREQPGDPAVSIPDFGKKPDHTLILEKYQLSLDGLLDEIFESKEDHGLVYSSLDKKSRNQPFIYLLQDILKSMLREIEEKRTDMELSESIGTGPVRNFKIRRATIENFRYDQYKIWQQVKQHELEIFDYLEEVYKSMDRMVQDKESSLLYYHSRISAFNFFWDCFKNDRIDRICIQIESLLDDPKLIFDLDKLPYLHLWDDFQFFETLLVQSDGSLKEPAIRDLKSGKVQVKGSQVYLFLEGPGLHELFSREEGIHLFFHDDITEPVAVTVHKLEDRELKAEAFITSLRNDHANSLELLKKGTIGIDDLPPVNGNVVRLYTQRKRTRKEDMITDLRSGTITKCRKLSQEEAELLMFFNLSRNYHPFT